MQYDYLNRNAWIIALIFIVLSGLFIQYPYMNEFPSYIHAWSQSDRYAIALGFLNNNFDLFHPETFIYNKQFPNDWNFPHTTTITSVDLPLMEFLVAILMKITGVTSPWIFRSCTLLIAVIGMFYLYKLAFLLTNDWIKSLLVTAVAMTSPVYAYYFNGFIPSIPAFTFAIIAMYCYVKYININKLYCFICAMIFITLSLLTRTSFAVIYVALLGFEFLRIIRKESECNGKILPISISIIVFILYYLWNKHLSSEHGTLFLSELMPADDWNDFISRMSEAKKYWLFHYFTEVHYRLFAISILFVVLYLVYNKLLHGKIDEVNVVSRNNSLWIFIIVSIFGYFLFTVAMAKQFPNHDYYFIDTYFLPILLSFILILKSLPTIDNYKKGIVFFMISAAFVSVMFKNVNEKQEIRRRNYWGAASERTIENYKDSEQFLDSIGISKDAKILTLWAYPQNTPFILMNRKGYTEMFDKEDKIEIGLSFDYDYVVIENELLEDDKKKRYLSDLNYVSDNGKISVFCQF